MSADSAAHYQSASELSGMIATRELKPSELLEVFLSRINELNPSLNAVVSLAVEPARELALAQDKMLPDPLSKPLLGLPIAVKDLALTRGITTTLGSPIYRDFVPDEDELFVSRLRAAGAIIIGKTNTPEFGAGSQTFNRVFGATCNPYDVSKTCGGSSGGAAVALASGMVPLADGSDLGGSLRNPASFCNVLGLRTTPGRVPAWPKPFSSDPFAVYGPMARSVDDLALLLSVMAGPDPRVPISLNDPGAIFRQTLHSETRGLRIAYSADLGGYEIDAEVSAVLEQALPVMAQLGCQVTRADPALDDADEIFRVFRAWMFASRFEDDYRNRREMLKDTLVWNIEQGLNLSAAELAKAEIKRSALLARVAEFFAEYDFLLCPAAQVPPFDLDVEWVREINGVTLETYLDWMGVCCAITVTGLPALSIPAGFTAAGLPIGMQIVGRRGAELELLKLARAFEQATKHAERRPDLSGVAAAASA